MIGSDIEARIAGLLRADVEIKASVIHERLVADHGLSGHYQRVRIAVARLRPVIDAEIDAGDEVRRVRGPHHRFPTLPCAQAKVNWGHEGDLLGDGTTVYSFHMLLSYSLVAFCCYTTSMNAAAFWAFRVRAIEHFSGVPGSIVYDRVATIVRRRLAPGKAVPLQPEALAFAGHHGYARGAGHRTVVLAADRPTGRAGSSAACRSPMTTC